MGILKHKVCLLGTFAVGKTSLVQRFVNDRFGDKYLTTVGVSVSKKQMPPVHSQRTGATVQHTLLIWDIAGLEKFDTVVMNYFRGSSGALAVGDLTRPETVADLAQIVDKFLSVNPDAPLVVIGNKRDLIKDQKASTTGCRQLAADLGSEMVLTSAKTGEQVADAFLLLSRKIEQDNRTDR